MDLQLEGKRAVVTGSSSGIGATIAGTLSGEGAIVVVHGRNADRARQIAVELPLLGNVAIVDLATPAGAQEVANRILETIGGLDFLVNNAGAFRSVPWMTSTPGDWLSSYNQNVVSMVRMIHAFAPHMKAAKWGRIIQIAGRAAIRPRTQMPDYAATKAAVLNMTVSLAKELAHERGWGTKWEDIERNFFRECDPSVRLGRPEDVAHAVAFLASPLAVGITGVNLRVGGGDTGTVA